MKPQESKTYLCIDLKCFYASVECVARGLDPFSSKLVVADPERSEKTICLAISPAMKALGVKNRCRVFEIPRDIDYLMAQPRMRLYMETSAQIYAIYLRYVSPEDIHVYSIDECFIDASPYLQLYGITPREFATLLMDAVRSETGICATVGIGTNLFLAKVALDITAKHVADHIGVLDEESFKQQLWTYRPISDIWNIGPGIARRLAKYRVFDLKGVCEMPPELLYKEFGVNAEFLIDHAWGQEPCTIADIQAYRPSQTSLSSSQVLPCSYSYEEALTVLKEMVEGLSLDLFEKGLYAGSISLSLRCSSAQGARFSVHASHKLEKPQQSFHGLSQPFTTLYEEQAARDSSIRQLHLCCAQLVSEGSFCKGLFDDTAAEQQEARLQEAISGIKSKYGKNSLLRGISYREKATARERNMQIGGHHA